MRYEFTKEDEIFRNELREWIRNEISVDFNEWQGVDETGDDLNIL
ncbi:MAG: hypothetical protein Ct9H90mP2_06510 [Dehalococcoidia bacterium]|nr:MAG: hypothetical protein Ct9H90mP2_06510 [Dehalococcoidia bacterium]